MGDFATAMVQDALMKLAQACELAATDPQTAAVLGAPASEQYNNWKDRNSVYPISGPGLVPLMQAEFGVYRQMLESGGLKGNALREYEGIINRGNAGINSGSAQRLEQLYNSRERN